MQNQIAALQGLSSSTSTSTSTSTQTSSAENKPLSNIAPADTPQDNPDSETSGKSTDSPKVKSSSKAHGPQLVLKTEQGNQLTDRQQNHLDKLIEDYVKRTPNSKQFTQKNRSVLSDPRTASGFSPQLKEITYPLIISSSSGCHLQDIDGNDYVDLVSGFGSNFFGFGASFVREAVNQQMERGMEIGPQSVLVEEAVSLFKKLVDCERVAFCNTGSEAVLATLRLARTITGKDTIVVFSGGYHGIFDEVVARPTSRGSRPAAPGIPQGSVDNILVLPWNDPASLEIIRSKQNDIAAVLTEPVQSRDPGTQPIEFLQQLRSLTEEIDSALIFDEVVCGFRTAPGGTQERFGIEADLSTYGKVVGGGMPIGVVAGKRKYMDALDGGHWEFGDDSNPTVGVTYFAGTFVRHPPALAAAISCLKFMIDKGPELQKQVDATAIKLESGLRFRFLRS